MLFARAEKTVERDAVFAEVRVDEERGFGVEIAERAVRGQGNVDEIADAVNVDDDLIGALIEECAVELGDHSRAGSEDTTNEGEGEGAANVIFEDGGGVQEKGRA